MIYSSNLLKLRLPDEVRTRVGLGTATPVHLHIDRGPDPVLTRSFSSGGIAFVSSWAAVRGGGRGRSLCRTHGGLGRVSR